MERTTVLSTPRLTITTWLWSDLDDLHRLHSDPETMRHVRNGRPESLAECRGLLAQYIEEQGRGWTKWRVADRGGELVGRAGFGSYDGARSLSYTVRRDRWGEGLATEIGTALVTWHRTHVDDLALVAHAAVANPASARVLTKVGFRRAGRAVVVGVLCDEFCWPADGESTS